jgi:transitional endoplasmic reticulum ATPase
VQVDNRFHPTSSLSNLLKMASADDFTFIDSDGPHYPPLVCPDYREVLTGKGFDPDVQIVTALREKHPELTVTSVPRTNLNLIQFAAAGYAQAELDNDTEPAIRWRGFVGPSHRVRCSIPC